MSPTEKKGSGMGTTLLVAIGGALAVLAYAGWHQSESDGPVEEAGQVNSVKTGKQHAKTPVHSAEIEGQQAEEAPPTPRKEGSQAHEILAEMRNTWECYEAPDCTVGDNRDPRADYFEAGKRMAAGMRALIEQHRSYEIGDVELANAAHELLGYESGRGRAAAIEALGELPPADEHLDALLTTLDQHHDEKLFELALPELERYAERGRHDEVDAFLQSNLRSGAHFSALTIAEELGPFLNSDNVASYRELAQELPRDSRRAALLKETLDAYEDKSLKSGHSD